MIQEHTEFSTTYNGGRIWVYSNTLKAGWVKVSYFREGTVTTKGAVVSGWVNAKLLGAA
jgi:hypothetical protein